MFATAIGSRIRFDLIRAVLVLAVCLLALRSSAAAQQVRIISAAAEAEAKRLYTEGKLEFAAGRFDEAIALFERAYTLSEAPGLLFNLAQAHRLAGESHCVEAHALYKSYLGAFPAAENRREVEERIAELRPCAEKAGSSTDAAQQVATFAPPLAPPPPRVASDTPPPRSRRGTLGPMLLTAAGAASVVAGGVLYARAASEYREAERRCPCYPGTFPKWERLTYVSYGLMGAGGAAVFAGASWWLSGVWTPRGTTALITLRGQF